MKIEIETGEPVNIVNAGEPVGTTRRQQAKLQVDHKELYNLQELESLCLFVTTHPKAENEMIKWSIKLNCAWKNFDWREMDVGESKEFMKWKMSDRDREG